MPPETLPPDTGGAELEARFIEQEHRLFKIISNYFAYRDLPWSDPRRKASGRAALWRIFSPGTAAVAGGGLIAAGSLVVLAIQTGLIAQQNNYFREQNTAIRAQVDQQATQEQSRRRTQVIANLYELVDPPQGTAPRSDARTRIEAVREFVLLERARLGAPTDTGRSPRINLAQVNLSGLNLIGSDFASIDLVGSDLQNTDLSSSDLTDADLRGSLFLDTSFAESQLDGLVCEQCNLNQSSFARASVRDARLTSASVNGVSFFIADLRGSDLTGVRDLDTAEWAHANIANVSGLDPEQRQMILRSGGVMIVNDKEWEARKTSLREQ